MVPVYQNFPFFCIFIALLTAILSTLISGKWARRVSMCMLGVEFALNLGVLAGVTRAGASFTYTMGAFGHPWGNELRAGPAEAALATAFCLLMLLCILAGGEDMQQDVLPEKQNLFFVISNMLLASLLALCYTNDLFTGYVFIEINTIASCALVMTKDTPHGLVATVRYLMMSLVGSGMFLFSLVLLYGITGHLLMPSAMEQLTVDFAAGRYREPGVVIAALMIVGLAVKSALYPFHGWLPDAYATSTTSATCILSGMASKGYIVLIIKIFMRVFTLEEVNVVGVQNILFAFGIAAMVFGSVNALHEQNLKRMLAYSSVAQIGYIYMGLGLGTQAGVTAALLQILVHAFTKPMLFAAGGVLIRSLGGEQKMFYFRSAGHRNPLAGVVFTIGGLSMVGLPLLGGFTAKVFLATGAAGATAFKMPLALAALVVSTVLNAWYYLQIIIQLWKPAGESFEQDAPVLPVTRFKAGPEAVLAMVVFVIVIVLLGAAYQPITDGLALGVTLL